MKKLIYYGGEGYSHSKEIGRYIVKHGEAEETETEFSRLSLAIKFYDSLECEKAIWNIDTHELLDAYAIEPSAPPVTYADVLAYCDIKRDIHEICHGPLKNGGYVIWINGLENRYAARTPVALLKKIKLHFDEYGNCIKVKKLPKLPF